LEVKVPNVALKDNQKSKVDIRTEGKIKRLSCRVKLPWITWEQIEKVSVCLEQVFPKRIKIEKIETETEGGVACLVLTRPRPGDCDKLDDVIELIKEALTSGKELVLPQPKLVGTGLIQNNGSMSPPRLSLPTLPTRRHERRW